MTKSRQKVKAILEKYESFIRRTGRTGDRNPHPFTCPGRLATGVGSTVDLFCHGPAMRMPARAFRSPWLCPKHIDATSRSSARVRFRR